MKIVSSGRALHSEAFHEKKRKIRRFKLILSAVVFCILLSLLIYMSRLDFLKIRTVTVLGEDLVGKEDISQEVSKILGGNYLWLIPRSNFFFYPKEEIKKELMNNFPRIKFLDLNLEGFNKLEIEIRERIPFALYCSQTTSISECYFLDESGLIFAEAPSFSTGVYFTYTTNNFVTEPVGKKILDPERFKQLTIFLNNLPVLKIQPSAMEIIDDEYDLMMENGGKIKWLKSVDLQSVYNNLEAFLSSDAIRSEKNFLDRIEYLDLRTENKVFYRFRE